MRVSVWSAATIVTLAAALPLQAGEIGDKAPALQIAKWVKGDAVDVTKADGKSVYVVEFWATWCGPCIRGIPDLTELQKQMKDKNVTIVGVSIDDQRTVKDVKPFVTKQGDRMGYTVAIDKDDATAKGYMEAFGVNGIPHAFVVDQKGRIAWHGHPMEGLEKVVAHVVAGTYDEKAKKQIADALAHEQAEFQKVAQLYQEYFQLATSTGKDKDAMKIGRELVSKGAQHADMLNAFAWQILTDDTIVNRDLPLALSAAETANKTTHGKDANVLDTYGLALFESGRKADAIKVQKQAIELAANEHQLEDFKQRLERFEKGAD